MSQHVPNSLAAKHICEPTAEQQLPQERLSVKCVNAGNGGSLEKCRRRWDLADAEFLKYKFMNAFDRAMNHLDKAYSFSDNAHQYVSRKVSDPPGCLYPLAFSVLVFEKILYTHQGQCSLRWSQTIDLTINSRPLFCY